MSRPARMTVLCEDLQTETFIRYFFSERGWEPHDFRILPYPCGQGSGEQFVREKLPDQLRAYRSRCNHQRIGLIVAVDADRLSVQERRDQLETHCKNEGIDPPKSDEFILIVIPKRNIETWRAYLREEEVNEDDLYRKDRGNESRCKPEAQKLHTRCQRGRLEKNPPPSLEQCCKDFESFWNLIH